MAGRQSTLFIKKTIIFAVLLCLSVTFLNFLVKRTFLTLFIVFFILERVYESFFTYKKTAAESMSEDPHLKAVVSIYSIMIMFSIVEFYFYANPSKPYFVIFGVIFLLISFILRWQSIAEMGDDWAIDTFAVPGDIHSKFIYSYVRHPYYIGVLLEVLSLNLILGTWISFFFSLSILVPLELRRAFLEEDVLVDEFGWHYIKYKREVNRFLPTLLKRKCYERRASTRAKDKLERKSSERRKKEINVKRDRRRII